MTERIYSEEDISKVMDFYNIHKHSKTYREMAYEYGICPSKFYYIVKKGLKKTSSKIEEFNKVADGFIKENGGDIMNVLKEDVVRITPLKTKNEWSKLKPVNEAVASFKKDGGYLVSVLGGCVEHKTGDTIKTQPTLQIKLGQIEHKIAELNGEIKKLEGYRDTLKQSIMILSMGL